MIREIFFPKYLWKSWKFGAVSRFAVREYSNDTLCSNSSNGVRTKCKSAASILRKRRVLQPLLGSNSPYHSSNSMSRLIPLQPKVTMSATTQKIMSARMLRVKQLQNELSEAQLQLSELASENRALRTLQKRQEVLLKRYESKQAALPQIMHSYEEEVRVLSSRLKQARAHIRTFEERLRTRDNELSALKDKCHHLEELSQSKHLRQREQLQQRLETLQDQLHDKEKTIQLLTRKVMLEGKNYKHQLAVEATRHRTARNELANALERIAQLELQLKKKDKYIASSMPRPISLLSLHTPSRFPSLPSQTRSEIVQVDPSVNLLEDDDEAEQDDQQDDQQDYSDSYTEPQTSTSQLSSLEIIKEIGHSNPSNVSMSLDYQAKRFQFSNQCRKKANAVEETTCTESTSGQSSKLPSIDQSKVEIAVIKASFQPVCDSTQKTSLEHRRSSVPSIGTVKTGDGSRKGSLSSLEVEKSKVKNLDFLSSLVMKLDNEAESLGISLKHNDTHSYCNGGAEETDSRFESSLVHSGKQEKPEEVEIQVKQSKSDNMTPIVSRKNSLAGNNGVEEEKNSRRNSLENVSKDSVPVDDASQRLQDISDSWKELEHRIKSDSNRVKAEVEKQLMKKSVMSESKRVEESKKKNLLEAIQVLHEDVEPVKSVKTPTIPPSLYVGSVTDSSVHNKPFSSHQHPKNKTKLVDDLYP